METCDPERLQRGKRLALSVARARALLPKHARILNESHVVCVSYIRSGFLGATFRDTGFEGTVFAMDATAQELHIRIKRLQHG